MVTGNKDNFISNFKQTIVPSNPALANNEDDKKADNEEGFCNSYLFFSYDIVNSTQFKSTNCFGWRQILEEILMGIHKAVSDEIVNAQLWRILGDEILFVAEIDSLDELASYVESIYEILINQIKNIKNGKFGNMSNYAELRNIQNILSLKAAAWIADVSISDECDEKNEFKNYFVKYDLRRQSANGHNYFDDFIGNDIDAGFRISEYTAKNRLILSFELAYLLNKIDSQAKNIQFIGYRQLKGIWDNRYYPILYYERYYESDKFKGYIDYKELFKDTLEYDEYITNPLFAEYLSSSDIPQASDVLQKVAQDRHLDAKLSNIEQEIQQSKNTVIDFEHENVLELHTVAVCYNSKNEILVVKRSPKRQLNPLCWDFGYSQASKELTVEQSIKDDYHSILGIDVELDVDKKRQQPVPLAMFTIEKDNFEHKGIIFLAKVSDKAIDKIKLDTLKYSAYKWLTSDELESFCRENQIVSDFEDTAEKAFERLENK